MAVLTRGGARASTEDTSSHPENFGDSNTAGWAGAMRALIHFWKLQVELAQLEHNA